MDVDYCKIYDQKIMPESFRGDVLDRRAMKLLHVIRTLDGQNIGGPSYALMGILKALAASGQNIECSVACNALSLGLAEDLTKEFNGAVAFHEFRVAKHYPFYYSADNANWLRDNVKRFDAVAIHGLWSWPAACAITRSRIDGVPFVIRPAGSLDPFDLQKKRVAKKLLGNSWLRWASRGGGTIHCTTNLEAERVETYGGRFRVEVLPLPVPDPLGGWRGSRQEARSSFDIPEDAFVLLFMSRINYKKGLDILLPALKELKRSLPGLVFIFAGEGSAGRDDDVMRYVEDEGFGRGTLDWVRRVGYLSGAGKMRALAASDCFVLPSRNENFGVSVVEAAGAGLALALSSGVYIAEDFRLKKGAVVLNRTVEDWVEGLLRLAQAPEATRAMGIRAREIWTNKYSAKVLGARYAQFYKMIA